jgi:hypothetical protein
MGYLGGTCLEHNSWSTIKGVIRRRLCTSEKHMGVKHTLSLSSRPIEEQRRELAAITYVSEDREVFLVLTLGVF